MLRHSYANCAVVVQDCLVSVANMVQVLVPLPYPTASNAQIHEAKDFAGVSAVAGSKDTNQRNQHHCTSNCLCPGFFLVALRCDFVPA